MWDFCIEHQCCATFACAAELKYPTGRRCVTSCVVSAPLAAALLDMAVAADPSWRAWFERFTCCLVLLWHRCTTRAMVRELQALGFGMYCRTQLYRYAGNLHASYHHMQACPRRCGCDGQQPQWLWLSEDWRANYSSRYTIFCADRANAGEGAR